MVNFQCFTALLSHPHQTHVDGVFWKAMLFHWSCCLNSDHCKWCMDTADINHVVLHISSAGPKRTLSFVQEVRLQWLTLKAAFWRSKISYLILMGASESLYFSITKLGNLIVWQCCRHSSSLYKGGGATLMGYRFSHSHLGRMLFLVPYYLERAPFCQQSLWTALTWPICKESRNALTPFHYPHEQGFLLDMSTPRDVTISGKYQTTAAC